MLFPIFLIIILGVVLFVFTFIFIKGIFAPKKIQYVQSLLSQGRTTNAIKVAKKIISKEPRNTAAHYFLGKAYKAEKNLEMALIEFKTINTSGRFDNICKEEDFRKEIAQLFTHFNQNEEALKEYLMLIKLEPMNAENFYQTGYLFEQRDRSDMAITYYQKAIQINAGHSDAHFRLGFIFYRKKKKIEARSEFETSLKSNPMNADAHFYLGRIKKDNHDFSGALQHFERSQKDADLKVKSIVERGTCFMSMNNFEKAILELSRAVNLSKEEASTEALYARYFLAHCYESSRKIEQAIEHWEKIYAKKPSFKDVGEKLSQYQELRQDDSVKDYLTSNQELFKTICEGVVTHGINLAVRETSDVVNGCQIIAVESESKWRNARKMPRLIRFFRIPEMIKDPIIRTMHEDMKKFNVNRGIIFSSSSYSRLAVEFAESRPIDLYDKDQLRAFLIKAAEENKKGK